ncbi:ORFY [Bluegill hepatitis B virus]|uniref:ORFY n=1 Tax=Bluegill hepatitis B virus TaxID=2169918 RepID=A0A193AUB4_9HEPA|nr:ORFY [Bluegill hepatitis B virus]ANN02853.1 ORFY [Bluegill hepatitis B virus]
MRHVFSFFGAVELCSPTNLSLRIFHDLLGVAHAFAGRRWLCHLQILFWSLAQTRNSSTFYQQTFSLKYKKLWIFWKHSMGTKLTRLCIILLIILLCVSCLIATKE